MKIRLFVSAMVMAFTVTSPNSVHAQQHLTGDVRLACEALLCLAASTRPSECTPSLQRYFSISARNLRDTMRGRLNFLNLCPAANQTPEMQGFAAALAGGAGNCDAQSLNASLRYSDHNGEFLYISDQMPAHCVAYMGHSYTTLAGSVPRYVGTKEKGGYWVEAQNYDQALSEYKARLPAIEAQMPRAGEMPIADLPPPMQQRVVCAVSAAFKYEIPANILLAIAKK